MPTTNLITVTLPNASNIAKGVAMSTIIGKTFPNGKPLPVVKEKVGLKGNIDYLGVPALTQLQFRYDNQLYVLNDCIMSVTQERNIVETALSGRDGTVKQYISDGDFSISVQAAIANDYLMATNQQYEINDAYPEGEIKLFIKLLKVKQALEVTSDWLDLFGIKSVVIKSYGFDQETFSNRQTFSMQMLSDEPFEIKILKDA